MATGEIFILEIIVFSKERDTAILLISGIIFVDSFNNSIVLWKDKDFYSVLLFTFQIHRGVPYVVSFACLLHSSRKGRE